MNRPIRSSAQGLVQRLLRRLLRRSGGSRPLLWIGGICVAVEFAILLGSALSGADLRMRAVAWLGFWPGLLDGWHPQSIWMFFTYWVVHTGPLHLFGNVAVLTWISVRLSSRLYAVDVWNIWIASVVGGGLAFAVLNRDAASMIGASGGVFGLIGALVVLGYRYTKRRPGQLKVAALRAALACLALAGLSVADVLLRGHALAWEAHLGGFLAGGLIAALGPYRAPLAPARDP